MKARLLKRLRSIGRNKIMVTSVTKTGGLITGFSYSYNDNEYRSLFSIGDTENDVIEKAARIYIKHNIDSIRKQYKKHSRLYVKKPVSMDWRKLFLFTYWLNGNNFNAFTFLLDIYLIVVVVLALSCILIDYF